MRCSGRLWKTSQEYFRRSVSRAGISSRKIRSTLRELRVNYQRSGAEDRLLQRCQQRSLRFGYMGDWYRGKKLNASSRRLVASKRVLRRRAVVAGGGPTKRASRAWAPVRIVQTFSWRPRACRRGGRLFQLLMFIFPSLRAVSEFGSHGTWPAGP